MAGAVGVQNDHVNVRFEKRRVVIAPVPDDDIGLPLRGLENFFVVDAGIDHDALGHQQQGRQTDQDDDAALKQAPMIFA